MNHVPPTISDYQPASDVLEAATLISPGYEQLGCIAMQHFMAFALCHGRPIRIHAVAESTAGFKQKLFLDQISAPNVLWFDADWWLLRPADFGEFLTGEFAAVRDPGANIKGEFPRTDCETHQLDRAKYINAGFFICPRKFSHIFPAARAYAEDKRCADYGDQSALNLALQRFNVPQRMLPFRYNFWKMAVDRGAFPFIPRNIIGLHGAGIPKDEKLAHLQAQRLVFSGEQLPLSEYDRAAVEALTWTRKEDL